MIRRVKGFSIFELLITLSILAIIIGMSSNTFVDRIQKESSETIVQQIFHSLHFARMEAIKGNRVVSVCGTSDFQNCSLDWTQGSMVYIDVNRDGKFSPEDIVLRINKHKPNIVQVTSGKVISIKYAPNGRCTTRSTLTIHSNNIPACKIVVYDSGRARIEYGLKT
ncbi:GspH/FimT family pseudopilin [Candidatus Berkiella cookevillensis]|uniref:Type II secretion system protein H n=1 Tax=Candidatus Berkiella cookevillensis TaxID=437022 RepID=A0A0Q9YF30_9GAMM|nr:GspH/FimT family pseudopilin [Candidatus Berkiella cookevillensis]